jgi:hypothetical protein
MSSCVSGGWPLSAVIVLDEGLESSGSGHALPVSSQTMRRPETNPAAPICFSARVETLIRFAG